MFRSIDRLGIHPIPTFAPPPLSLLHVQDLVEILVRAAERGTAPRASKAAVRHPAAGLLFRLFRPTPDLSRTGPHDRPGLGRRHVFLLHLVEPLPWLVAGVTELIARLAISR